MRITGVDVILMDESHPDNTGWSPVVCRVYTDEGLYGDGEAAIAYSIGSKAAWSMVQEMGNRVLGMDPLENEVVWHNLYRTTFWAQNGGPIVWAGISAIDIALWDIKGNHFGVPVSTLLGGKMRSSLRCYASQLQFGWGTKKEPAATIEGYARNARAAVDEGYDAVKVDFFDFSPEGRFFTIEERTRLQPPQRLALVEERLAAVREALRPRCGHHHGKPREHRCPGGCAVRLARPEVRGVHVRRARQPESQDHAVRLRARFGAHRAWRAHLQPLGVRAVLRKRLHPDDPARPGKLRRHHRRQEDLRHGLHLRCGRAGPRVRQPLSTAAALQLEAAIPNFTIHEHHVYARYDYNRRLCVRDYQPENGRFDVPDLPGLGNELAEYCWRAGTVARVR